ncbi:MAG: hypothetical protein JW954_08170 [Dehalococcoidaceae bacterium]|nr:hypothetical protein [Dehalococcoidaceae bacterium]
MKRIVIVLILVQMALLAGACSSSGGTEPSASVTSSISTCPVTLLGEARVTGAVYFNGNPITDYTDSGAQLGLIEVEAWEAIPLQSSYFPITGTYVLAGIPPGEYLPFITIESGYPFNVESGGDFTGRLSGINPNIVISSNEDDVNVDLSVVYHLHLVSPYDNQQRNISVSDEPENIFRPQSHPEYIFEWEAVPDAASYRVTVVLKDDNSNTSENIVNQTTGATSLALELQATQGSQYYMFSVTGYSQTGELIGLFQYYYTNGSGGWYKFVVRP